MKGKNTVKAEIGVIGLAVMGQNLALNLADKGFKVVVYNRTAEITAGFTRGPAKKQANITGSENLEQFMDRLARPAKIIIMIRAGDPVDKLIEQLNPYLKMEDLLIDGGNSLHTDTTRRQKHLESRGVDYIGLGISGGELGARFGPSLMAGGSGKAWPKVEKILKAISAKVGGDPCCAWLGEQGAGHFVKMIHNGIEYGDIQLICEIWDIMHRGLGLTPPQAAEIFAAWNHTELQSYLIEITAQILRFSDTDGEPLVTRILDKAGQKGTGKWTVASSLDFGIPATVIAEAVMARSLSTLKEERLKADKLFRGPESKFPAAAPEFIESLKNALLAAKITIYSQGFMIIRAAGQAFGWQLPFAEIAKIWRGGCIIRSAFLNDISRAFSSQSNLENLILAPYFKNTIEKCQSDWRRIVASAVSSGIPAPALASGLSFFDGYRSARLPAYLLQAQRDYFGGHLYERVDRSEGELFHADWTGKGGKTSSSSYSV